MDFINDQSTEKKSNEGAKMVLLDVLTGIPVSYKLKGDAEPQECYLMLLGPESYAVRVALMQSQSTTDSTGSDEEKISPEEVEANRVRDAKMLADITVGGRIVMKSKWVDVTPEVAYKLYYAVMSARVQATRFALNLGNFKS